jgi:hypothetical protein
MCNVETEASGWLSALRAYLVVSAAVHLIWEILQLPLYTIWTTGTAGQIAFAVLHCTAGDVLIATLSLVVALALFATGRWPAERNARVFAAAVLIGVGYTIYSEWLNTGARSSWAYSPLMPVVPVLGTGLSPILQWLVVPTVAVRIATGTRLWRAPG